jgi:hypothetical protein
MDHLLFVEQVTVSQAYSAEVGVVFSQRLDIEAKGFRQFLGRNAFAEFLN